MPRGMRSKSKSTGHISSLKSRKPVASQASSASGSLRFKSRPSSSPRNSALGPKSRSSEHRKALASHLSSTTGTTTRKPVLKMVSPQTKEQEATTCVDRQIINLLPLPCFNEACLRQQKQQLADTIVVHNRTEIKYNQYQLRYMEASALTRAILFGMLISSTFIVTHILFGVLADANFYEVTLKPTKYLDNIDIIVKLVLNYYSQHMLKRLAGLSVLLIMVATMMALLIACSGFWCAMIYATLQSIVLVALVATNVVLISSYTVMHVALMPIMVLMPLLITILSWTFLLLMERQDSIMPSLEPEDLLQDHHHHIVTNEGNDRLQLRPEHLVPVTVNGGGLGDGLLVGPQLLMNDGPTGSDNKCGNVLNLIDKLDREAKDNNNNNNQAATTMANPFHAIRDLIYNHTRWSSTMRTHRTSVYLTVVHNLRWIFSDPKKLATFNPKGMPENLSLVHLLCVEKVALCEGFLIAMIISMEMEILTIGLIISIKELYKIELQAPKRPQLGVAFNVGHFSSKWILVLMGLSVVGSFAIICIIRTRSQSMNLATMAISGFILFAGILMKGTSAFSSILAIVLIFYGLFLATGSVALYLASARKRKILSSGLEGTRSWKDLFAIGFI